MNESALRLFVRSLISEAKDKEPKKKEANLSKSSSKSADLKKDKKPKKVSGNLVEMKKSLAEAKDKAAKIDALIADWEQVKSAAGSLSYGKEGDIEIGADAQEQIMLDCDKEIEKLKKEKASLEEEMASLEESTLSEISRIKEMMGLIPEEGQKKIVGEKKKMTPDQKDKKENIVKGMKKSGSFGKSKDEKSKMYATATKLATKNK
jgi:hypothetical protein